METRNSLISGLIILAVILLMTSCSRISNDDLDEWTIQDFFPMRVPILIHVGQDQSGYARVDFPEEKDHVLYINENPVGLDLGGLNTDESLRVIRANPEAVRSIALDYPTLADGRVAKSIKEITPHHLVLAIYGSIEDPEGYRSLVGLGRIPIYIVAEDMNDEALVELVRADNLRYLDLGGCGNINPDGFTCLSAARQLRELSLINTRAGDETARAAASLKYLKRLWFSGTAVTDEGAAALSVLTNLRILALSKTMITDKCLEKLTSLKELRRLDLNGTAITDQGMRFVGTFTELLHLAIADTQCTKEGVNYLAGLENLQYLDIQGTDIKSEDVESVLPQFRNVLF